MARFDNPTGKMNQVEDKKLLTRLEAMEALTPKEPRQQTINEKVYELLDAAYRINNNASCIMEKIFGSAPVNPSNGKESLCLEDLLNEARRVLEEAYSTLSQVNENLK